MEKSYRLFRDKSGCQRISLVLEPGGFEDPILSPLQTKDKRLLVSR